MVQRRRPRMRIAQAPVNRLQAQAADILVALKHHMPVNPLDLDPGQAGATPIPTRLARAGRGAILAPQLRRLQRVHPKRIAAKRTVHHARLTGTLPRPQRLGAHPARPRAVRLATASRAVRQHRVARPASTDLPMLHPETVLATPTRTETWDRTLPQLHPERLAALFADRVIRSNSLLGNPTGSALVAAPLGPTALPGGGYMRVTELADSALSSHNAPPHLEKVCLCRSAHVRGNVDCR